jgi:hypothetical protein
MVARPHSTTDQSHPPKGRALFEVDTPQGRKPFVPPGPEPMRLLDDEGNPIEDNILNPRGQPSLSLPQQATPLTSEQGVIDPRDLEDPAKVNEIMVQDGLAPDNPLNPRGTPDYIVEGLTDPDAATTVHQIEPTTTPVSNTPITLTVIGMGFDEGSEVAIDGAPATSTQFVNQNRLVAQITPDSGGVKQITVGDSAPIPFEVTTEGVDGREKQRS